MKFIKVLVLAVLLANMFFATSKANAQCAICTTNVNSNHAAGGTQTNGLNSGILYLLFAPYLAVAIGGYVWYKQYKRKSVSLNMNNDRLHSN